MLRLVVTYKCLVICFIALLMSTDLVALIQFNAEPENSHRWHRWAAWDGGDYLRLSSDGYSTGSAVCAFYPLWPASIRCVSTLIPHRNLIVGVILANAFSIVALCFLYKLAADKWGASIGRDSTILLMAFPGALFFSIPYTESLFLLLVLGLFLALSNWRVLWIVIIGCLLPLTRAIGIFIVLPLLWYLYEERKLLTHWWILLSPLLGYVTYFALMYAWTGNCFEGFMAQRFYPNAPSLRNMMDIHGFLNAFANIRTVDGMLDGALDRVFFILWLVLLPVIYRMNRTWFWYALPAGLVPALSSWFISYRRYLIVCFPVFVALAHVLEKKTNRWLFWYYVVFLAALQIVAIVQFSTANWAG
ncbi:MAG TPA: hypothetical protein VFE51_24955 [Verrucomicrobiae bacterium]|nr:hypothetical protein [Verrucomicrobiae bacterium]